MLREEIPLAKLIFLIEVTITHRKIDKKGLGIEFVSCDSDALELGFIRGVNKFLLNSR